MTVVAPRILKAIDKIRSKLSDLIIDATVRIRTLPQYDMFTGQKDYTVTDIPVQVVISEFDYMEIQAIRAQGMEVQADDVKLILFNDSQYSLSVDTSALILLNGKIYRIMLSTPVYVGKTIALYTLQVRI